MLNPHAQDGYALALAESPELDAWCQAHPEIATAAVEQLARHAIPLTASEYAQQIGRRLAAMMAIGPDRAARALGLGAIP
jgi:hypothetical protein